MKKSELKQLIKEVFQEVSGEYTKWKFEDLKDALLDPEVLINHKSEMLDELLKRAKAEGKREGNPDFSKKM